MIPTDHDLDARDEKAPPVFEGPTEGYIDKSWVLNDFELLK